MRRGTVIVLTGIDGSGKTTAARSLAEYLRTHGFRVKTVWIRSLHTFAYIIWSLFHLSGNERIIINTNKMVIKQFRPGDLGSFKRIWPIIEFVSVLPLILFRVYLPKMLGTFVVADRFLIDTVISTAIRTENPAFVNSYISKILLAMIPSDSIIIHMETSYETVRKRRPDIEYTSSELKQQIRLYSLLSKELRSITINTDQTNTKETLSKILQVITSREKRANASHIHIDARGAQNV